MFNFLMMMTPYTAGLCLIAFVVELSNSFKWHNDGG